MIGALAVGQILRWLPCFTQIAGDQFWDEPRLTESAEEKLSGPYCYGPTLKPYDVCLQDWLKESSLQIIVKIGGIHLTPERPHYEQEDWQIQGFLNDHVVAIALLPFDIQNISLCAIEFRQETSFPQGDYVCCSWREHADHDTINPSMQWDADKGPWAAQYLGEVELRLGRLISFPNVVEHRIRSFDLVDTTRHGHIRFISLLLVDPHYRICSTRNVPAQQHDWWAEGAARLLQWKGLPPELCELITRYCDSSPGDDAHAERNRELLEEAMELLHCARYENMRY